MKHTTQNLFIVLYFAFIVTTIIGTISHELGHYAAAKHVGYDAHISYNSTKIITSLSDPSLNASKEFIVAVGGPLQTILTGTLGLILLFVYRKQFKGLTQLSFGKWFIIFLSLFWLRPTTNFFAWVAGPFLKGQFSSVGDEIKLTRLLHIPEWTILGFTAAIGAAVLVIVIFKFVPENQRLTFMTAGFTGGVSGYVLWFLLLGKYILP